MKRIKLTEDQFNRVILKEGLSINSQGELVDDDSEFITIDNNEKNIPIYKGDWVSVMVWVGNQDFVFPGHYGTVSVIGRDENNGKPKGVLIEEDLQDGDTSLLYNKGYLDWEDDRWNFYPYYDKETN